MYLVNSPDATAFMQRMSMDTGRRAFLGDKARYHGSALNHIGFAHNAVAELAQKIAGLAEDKTRSEPQRHAAARRLANNVAATLAQSQAGIEAAAVALDNEANGIIAERFALDPSRQMKHAEMRCWVKEQASRPDGIMAIREKAKTNSELVAVINDASDFLLNLSEDTRGGIVVDGFKRFAPEGWAKIEQAQKLRELAAKYPAIIKQVHHSSYHPAIADQAASRVEI